ncbi:MAG: acyltransferase family protein [Paludibacteraceae bacterium]|nr:acyltransferase family protein [Paludibacteraceae bacterium]
MGVIVSNCRDSFWDTLKATLIILVVLGHTGTAIGDRLLSVIYMFHMPLFVFVSGYFSKKKKLSEMSDCHRLIVLFLIFNFLFFVFDVASGCEITIKRLLTPSFAMWYLLSLVFWRLLLNVIPMRIIENKKAVLLFSVLIALLAGFFPIGQELSFQRTCAFLPFFVLGYYGKQVDFKSKIKSLNKPVISVLLIAIVLFAYFLLPVFYCNTPYETMWDCGMRFLQLIVALLASSCVIGLSPNSLGRYTDLGRYTLLIYLLHPPIIKMMKLLCQVVSIEQNLLIAFLMTIITVSFIYAIRNFRFLSFLR